MKNDKDVIGSKIDCWDNVETIFSNNKNANDKIVEAIYLILSLIHI